MALILSWNQLRSDDDSHFFLFPSVLPGLLKRVLFVALVITLATA
jgi:hypothetical protein